MDSAPCQRCQRAKAEFGGRCNACRIYWQRNGIERPLALIERDEKKAKRARWCKVCGNPEIKYSFLCTTCWDYQRRTGKQRPRHLWADDLLCENCKFPKAATRRNASGRLRWRKTRCELCSVYWRKYKVERPEACWGIGPYGWCSCGYPAERMFKKICMCNRCLAEARQGAYSR